MPTNNHSVKDVLEDKSLIDPEVLESPQEARTYAKGIVLCQQIGFSKGSYANLRQLKHSILNFMEEDLPAIASSSEGLLIY